MTEDLLKTPLHSRHVAMEASMGDEGGWAMPLSYTGPLEEAAEVRRRAGVYDAGNLGRIRIRGDESLELLERACTHDVARQEDDSAALTLLLNERAGILDCGFLLRLENWWVLTTSPACREKVLVHLQALAGDFDATVDDQSRKTTQIGVAGPAGAEVLDAVLPFKASELPRGGVKMGMLMIARYIAARAGSTGLWCVEVMLPNMAAGLGWDFITRKAGDSALPPVGAAARDLLRVEAGVPRYGHELSEQTDPFMGGLGERLDFDHEFLGAPAARELAGKTPARRLVRLEFASDESTARGGCIPRLGDRILDGDAEVGQITSGAYSPERKAPIALAYVRSDLADPGTRVNVGSCPATVA